jgi:micrococcal nuclease
MEKRLWAFLSGIIGVMVLVGLVGRYLEVEPEPGIPAEPVGLEVRGEVLAAEDAVPVMQANARVTKVVDGDTLEVELDGEAGTHKVRLLGINTPETVDPRRPVECFGKEASAKMKELAAGKRIRLLADPQADERDKYGRLLRNAFLEDGTDINAYMVREGYAYAYVSFPQDARRKQELKKLEYDAKMAELGLWSKESCSGTK